MPIELNDVQLTRCLAVFNQCLTAATRFTGERPEQTQALAALGGRAESQFGVLDAALSNPLAGTPFPADIAATADEILTATKT